MARLRPIHVTHVLTFEEKTRVTNFFKLLVEIDVRLPKATKQKTTKAKADKCEVQKGKHIEKNPCCCKCPAMCNASGKAWWDLFLNPFNRIFNGVTFDLCSVA